MQPRRRVVASLGSVVMLVLGVSAWLVFAPVQLGGHTSYVIINGNSMEPGMQRGDLAVLRDSPAYHEGDIVTYRHPQIGNVIHRVIGRDGERYLFQGDNNGFVDPYHPARTELVGKLWFHVPEAGTWLIRFRSPVYATALLAVAFVGIGGGVAVTQKHRPRRRRRLASLTAQARTPMESLSRGWRDVLVSFAAAVLGLGVLAYVAFGNPTVRLVPDEVAYTQSGVFGYAAAASGDVYETGSATTGAPIYRRLSDSVEFAFTYSVTSAKGSPASLTGGYQFVAEVSDGTGWKRTMDLGSGSFDQVPATFGGALNIADVQAHITALEAQTGAQSQSYTVSVVPRIEAVGSIEGKPAQLRFAPVLKMPLDAVSLKLAPRGTDAPDPLAPLNNGLLQGVREEANTIGLPLRDLKVSAARWLSVGGVGIMLCLAGVYVVLLVRFGACLEGQPGRLETRLRDSLVRVNGVPVTRARTIDVASLDGLARVAQREGCVILQEARPGYQAFFVHVGDVTYRHQALGEPKGEARAVVRKGSAA